MTNITTHHRIARLMLLLTSVTAFAATVGGSNWK
jgi:hypothetical protein